MSRAGCSRAQALLRRGLLRHRRPAQALVRDLRRRPGGDRAAARWSSGPEPRHRVHRRGRVPGARRQSCTHRAGPRGRGVEVGVEPSSVTQLGNDSIRVTTEARRPGQEPGDPPGAGRRVRASAPTTSRPRSSGRPGAGRSPRRRSPRWSCSSRCWRSSWRSTSTGAWRSPRSSPWSHDIVITIGVYSLLQFEVTPSTVIGLLTILGYSLYDTVVVFDKVKENTRGILGQSRQTYSQAANLAVNQTLVRSINTSDRGAAAGRRRSCSWGPACSARARSRTCRWPCSSGMAAGAYSSVFIATPLPGAADGAQPADAGAGRQGRSPGRGPGTADGAAAAAGARSERRRPPAKSGRQVGRRSGPSAPTDGCRATSRRHPTR